MYNVIILVAVIGLIIILQNKKLLEKFQGLKQIGFKKGSRPPKVSIGLGDLSVEVK